MPDVAMATATLVQLQINDIPESLQLDLGDGPGHLTGGAVSADVRNISHQHVAPSSFNNYHRFFNGRPSSPYDVHRPSPGPSSHHTGLPRFL
jgi:BTB/POZ domain-containing protein 7